MDDDRAELISRLFALLTAQLEDSAAFALAGQGRDMLPVQHERAQALEAKVRDAHTITQAVIMLSQPCRSPAEASTLSAS